MKLLAVLVLAGIGMLNLNACSSVAEDPVLEEQAAVEQGVPAAGQNNDCFLPKEGGHSMQPALKPDGFDACQQPKVRTYRHDYPYYYYDRPWFRPHIGVYRGFGSRYGGGFWL